MLFRSMHSEEDGRKTFNASTKYDWYILQKIDCKEPTIVKDEVGKVHRFSLPSLPFLPNFNYDDFWKIVAKEEDEKCEVIFSSSIYETRKLWMSDKKTDKFQYPCVYGMQQDGGITYWYSDNNDRGHFGTSKVILGWGRHLYPIIDMKGTYGLTQNAFGIKVDSLEEAKNIKTVIESERFKEIIRATKWGSFQTDWRMFKYFKKDFWKEFIE